MDFDEKAFTTALGSRLQRLRLEKGFTLEAVVDGTGLTVSKSSLSAIENGKQEISAGDLYRLSTLLEFSMNDLVNEAVQEVMEQKYAISLDR